MLKGSLTSLKKEGVKKTPSWQRCTCVELPYPEVIELKNPMARFCTLKSRKQNVALAVAESLWILAGMNDLDSLPGHYAKSIYAYSDNGSTYRAGYGPRIRFFQPSTTQYQIGVSERSALLNRGTGYTDQFKFCIEQLKKDKFTRQAVITIHDPSKDDFDVNGNLLSTRDCPCSRSIQFMCNSKGELNCYVHMRSNDVLHGLSAINVAEFTFLQQIVSQICGLPLGRYYHIANSLHYYEDLSSMVEKCSKEKIKEIPEMEGFSYEKKELSLGDVDKALDILLSYESSLVKGLNLTEKNPFYVDDRLQVFSDYAEVLRLANCRKHKVEVENGEFFHPQLQRMYQEGQL